MIKKIYQKPVVNVKKIEACALMAFSGGTDPKQPDFTSSGICRPGQSVSFHQKMSGIRHEKTKPNQIGLRQLLQQVFANRAI